MKSSFIFSVYAEPQNDDVPQIKEFDDDEWSVIFDLFLRLSRKFKSEYSEINNIKINNLGRTIEVIIDKNIISSEEIEYFSDVLMGYESDNIIIFDDINYIMRGLLIGDEDSSDMEIEEEEREEKEGGEKKEKGEEREEKEELTFLEKMNLLTIKNEKVKKEEK